MALAVVEDLIGIARDVDFRNHLTRFRFEHDELGWKTAPDKKPMISFIQSDRKISKGQVSFPRCDHFAFIAIDHCYLARGWNIYENTLPLFFQLESLGMGSEFDRSNGLALWRADDSDSSTSEAHIKALR